MSVKIFAELSPVSTKRTIFNADPKPIADIIRELNTGFPLAHARVCRNGEIVKDFAIAAQDGDTLWIKFVPYGADNMGAGMKAGGWLLAFVGIVITAATWGAGSGIGIALIGTGLGMALGGTVLMNINIPPLSDQEKPDNDPSIRGAKNQARPHGRIPVLFGRHRIYPDLAANPHTEIINGQQYFTQLFCGGYKDCVIDIDSFKLGETALVDLSETESISQILSGADPLVSMEILQNGEAPKLYPYCVHEDTFNAPLQNLIDGGGGNKISGEIIRTTPDNTDTINVDIFLYNGIGKYNKNGGLESASVTVEAYYKDDNSPYELLGYFNSGSNELSGAELKTKRYQITKQGLAPGVYTVKIVRVTEDSSDSKTIDTVHIGSIRSIKSVRPIRPGRQSGLTIIALRVMATARLNNVLDSFNYVATSKLPVYSGSGSGALYWLGAEETRNPAAMLLYALRGRPAQQSVDAGDIDWAAFESFYLWCEEHSYYCNAYLSESVTIAQLLRMIGSTARAEVLRIDSKISVVQDIERPSPVQLFTPKNTVNYSVTMFNADIPQAIALRFIDEEAGYVQNEAKVYNTPLGNEIPGIDPETIQNSDLWGITGSAQARRIGMYNYACLKNRPFVHAIEADIEYLLCNKGDWIQYAGDIALTGAVQGRIRELIWADGLCIGIITDEPVVYTSNYQAAVRIRKSDGTIILKDAHVPPGKLIQKAISYFPSSGSDIFDPALGDFYPVDGNNVYYEPGFELYFIEPLSAKEAPKPGNIYAFGRRGYEAIDLIITEIQPQANLCATLTCVEYSPAIFGVDDPDFELPEFENKITPVSGAVDSGVVSPDNWNVYLTYHDGDTEPLRPTGDGQSGGWHYVQTPVSVWQSTKMAKSISDGGWGPPVYLKGRDGQFTDYRFAKNSSPNTAPAFTANADNPGGNWNDTPPSISSTEYLWMIQADWQGSERLSNWSTPVRISGPAGADGVTPVFLTLSPQSRILECDADGTPLVGILPFTSQARLFNGNVLIPSLFSHNEIAQIQPLFFPGTGGEIFSPMLGDFYPVKLTNIEWSLPGAPPGVSIDKYGLVTVNVGAALSDETEITIRAAYQNQIFTVVLYLSKERRSSADRYLGTVTTLATNDAQVSLAKGPLAGMYVRARQGDFVLSVTADLGGRPAGSVFQWTGLAWEYRDPTVYTDLYIRCFKDGFDVPGLAQDMGWFGALFAKLLVAQQAFIEELQAQIIQVNAAIFGGKRFVNVNGQIIDKGPGYDGFSLDSEGILKASGAEIKGHIEADSGTFAGHVEAASGSFNGTVNIDYGELRNVNIRENATIEGNITIKSGRFQIVPDSEIEKIYTNPQINNGSYGLRAIIASDFGIPVSSLYAVSYGYAVERYGYFTGAFDAISLNGSELILFRNGIEVYSAISVVFAGTITIRMGSSDMVMVYDAPPSSLIKNGVYRESDGGGNYYLKVKA